MLHRCRTLAAQALRRLRKDRGAAAAGSVSLLARELLGDDLIDTRLARRGLLGPVMVVTVSRRVSIRATSEAIVGRCRASDDPLVRAADIVVMYADVAARLPRSAIG